MHPRETQITMVKSRNAGGQTKRANERSFVYRHQYGGDDVTCKPPIPSEWKDARVTPIVKSGARNDCFE